MKIDDNTKRFIMHRLKWPLIYVGIGIVLVFALPFPYDFFSVLALFILINFLRGRSVLKRYGGTGGIKDMFGSLSGYDQRKPLKYYCMNCGKEHSEIACPSCGSKMKRV